MWGEASSAAGPGQKSLFPLGQETGSECAGEIGGQAPRTIEPPSGEEGELRQGAGWGPPDLSPAVLGPGVNLVSVLFLVRRCPVLGGGGAQPALVSGCRAPGVLGTLGNLRPREEQGLARGPWGVGVGQLSCPGGAAGSWRGPRVRGQRASPGQGTRVAPLAPACPHPWQVTLLQTSRLCPESHMALARAPGRARAQQEPRASQWFLSMIEQL